MRPIAIIGMACRFPGAPDLDAYWRLLRDGVDAVKEVPADRWDAAALYDPRPDAAGHMSTRWGGFLSQIDLFDADFFGIAPREAMRMDPQQRLLLEVAWEAIEDAGQTCDRLAGSPTGVFIGISTNDYGMIQFADRTGIDAYVNTGNALSIAANRISYAFDLRGPSITVDTACSSSLLAVHLACESLLRGESEVALTGGANLILTPEITIGFSKLGAMAPDGRCKTFDSRADGYVRGEGVGVVLLKTLASALRDGDPIHAVIRGTASNNDGRSNGLTAPNRQAQEAVLSAAYRRAGIDPSRVDYVEAHGTGTPLGDTIEARALGAVMAPGRPQERPCAVGSVKTNFGHLEAAAGIAGLIKVALALKHRTLPPNLHFRELNPLIASENLPLHVQASLAPWPIRDAPGVAGVSSFGFGGTNVHAVLEEAPPPVFSPVSSAAMPADGRAHLLPLSARARTVLTPLVERYRDWLRSFGQVAPELADICHSAGTRRSHHDHRVAFVARSREELVDRLDAFLANENRPGTSLGRRLPNGRQRLIFVFSGQGSQWLGMARDLIEQEPAFAEALTACDRAVAKEAGWSLIDELKAPEALSRLEEIGIVQPLLFAIEVSLAGLWNSWGILPDEVIGHSMGEVAAACVAGCLSLDEAVKVICERSRLLGRISGQGAMATVELSCEEAETALSQYAGRLSIAAHNGPKSIVISGDRVPLQELVEKLTATGIFCRIVNVDAASHSPQVDRLRGDLLESLKGLRPRAAAIPFCSTVTADLLNGCELDALYWTRNLREPVHFATAVTRLLKDGPAIFLELSPHPILSTAIEDIALELGQPATALVSMRRGEGRTAILAALGALYTQGLAIAWDAVSGHEGRRVRLPGYPWQHEQFWVAPEVPPGTVEQDHSLHPLLGLRRSLANLTGSFCWEIEITQDSPSFVQDHCIRGSVLLPSVCYIEMAIAAATELLGPGPIDLANIEFVAMLSLPKGTRSVLQLVVSPTDAEWKSFRVYSRPAASGASSEVWTLHARGKFRRGTQVTTSAAPSMSSARIRSQCPTTISDAEHYAKLWARGYQYGTYLRGLGHLCRSDSEALGLLNVSLETRAESARYHLHPAIVEIASQVLLLGLPADDATYVPAAIQEAHYAGQRTAEPLWSHAQYSLKCEGARNYILSSMRLFSDIAGTLFEARGIRLQRIGGKQISDGGTPDQWIYELAWRALARPRQATSVRKARSRSWLIFADREVGPAMTELLRERGDRCITVSVGDWFHQLNEHAYEIDPAAPEHFQRLFEDLERRAMDNIDGIVHLWTLSGRAPSEDLCINRDQGLIFSCFSVISLVQALSRAKGNGRPRLWLVSKGVQLVAGDIEEEALFRAPLWGLGRTIWHEHSELSCTLVDLSSLTSAAELNALVDELISDESESQIVLRDKERYVARLTPMTNRKVGSEVEPSAPFRQLIPPADGRFRLQTSSPHTLDSLILQRSKEQSCAEGEVEIEVVAAGLNFSDVMKALDIYPRALGDPLPIIGAECAGIVRAVGSDVRGLSVGDEVVAMAPFSFANKVITPAQLVARKPGGITFVAGATIPIAFATAYLALHDLGRLHNGERALIHTATGGIGLAAVQIARWIGAEIFATAGNPEKREFLRQLGIKHVMDSRSTEFAGEILEHTDGEGVDVVLNSLSGAAVASGLSVLRPYGRFIEIEKTDIYRNKTLNLLPFSKGLSFSALDLEYTITHNPEVIEETFRALVKLFADGSLQPLPVCCFPIERAPDAFVYMAQAKHIGKVVIELGNQDRPRRATRTRLVSGGTYLITGGTGDLGLAVGQWLINEGARHLVLCSRHAPSEKANRRVAAMRECGAEVSIIPADVTKAADVADLFTRIDRSMPPLKGIIHAAGILSDGVLTQMGPKQVSDALAPKVAGGWELHRQTQDRELDFFILFSSAASLLGSPGQGNYAAANAFLDCLAHHRRCRGLPAVSINWGPWAEVGLAARRNGEVGRAFNLAQMITPEQGIALLGEVLAQDRPQIAVLPFDWSQWSDSVAPDRVPSVLEELVDPKATDGGSGASLKGPRVRMRETVLHEAIGHRVTLIEDYLRLEIALVLRLPASRIELDQRLTTFGIDSLMAIELRNRIAAELGVLVSIATVLRGPTLGELARQIAAELESDYPEPSPADFRVTNTPSKHLELIERLAQERPATLETTIGEMREETVDTLLSALIAMGARDRRS